MRPRACVALLVSLRSRVGRGPCDTRPILTLGLSRMSSASMRALAAVLASRMPCPIIEPERSMLSMTCSGAASHEARTVNVTAAVWQRRIDDGPISRVESGNPVVGSTSLQLLTSSTASGAAGAAAGEPGAARVRRAGSKRPAAISAAAVSPVMASRKRSFMAHPHLRGLDESDGLDLSILAQVVLEGMSRMGSASPFALRAHRTDPTMSMAI